MEDGLTPVPIIYAPNPRRKVYPYNGFIQTAQKFYTNHEPRITNHEIIIAALPQPTFLFSIFYFLFLSPVRPRTYALFPFFS